MTDLDVRKCQPLAASPDPFNGYVTSWVKYAEHLPYYGGPIIEGFPTFVTLEILFQDQRSGWHLNNMMLFYL